MKTKNIILIFLLVAVLYSCRKGHDLYVNPNLPVNSTPKAMLAGVEAYTTMNYEGGTARLASIFVQYQSGVVAQSMNYDRYVIGSADMDNFWINLYVGAMKNAKLMYDNYENAYPFYAGIARVNMAFNLGIATELWGDVPYSQAWQLTSTGGATQPRMDAQQDILNDIQYQLNQALVDFSKPATVNAVRPGNDDILLQGNIPAWIKVAWTLKARYHNLLSNRDPQGSADSVLYDLSKGLASNTDNMYTNHKTSNDQNQWAQFQNARGYNVACQILIDSLGNMNDPRTPWYFDTTGTGTNGQLNGHAVGNPLGSDTVALKLGPYLYNAAANLPTPLVTYAETEFLKAEAYVRQGNSTNALLELNNAIAASIQNVTRGTGKLYTKNNAFLNTVITEKWKAMFGQPLEAYADYRRTGFPNLMVRPHASMNCIPKRFPVDLQEENNNPNAVFIPLTVPVWFAQ